jgi:HPt (histidine-containing phosphotransfer) domain-containing protein
MAGREKTGALDFDYLETYADGDMVVVEEVLNLFREQAALWLRVMDPHDPGEGWRDAIHSLKGTALGVGAVALAQACSTAEWVLGDAHMDRTLALIRVRDAVEAVLADITIYQYEKNIQSLRD